MGIRNCASSDVGGRRDRTEAKHNGHLVTKKQKKASPAARKGRLAKRVSLVREIVKEVAGLAPYEKRIAELLRIGKDKRALKYAKKKLGTHIRGKAKREEIAEVLRKARK